MVLTLRKKLENIYGQRDRFYGEFDKFGTKFNNYSGKLEKTILFLNIRDKTGKIITDHLWFNFTKAFEKAKLEPGDLIRFEARVDSYSKGYEKDIIDYKLSRPSKVVKMKILKFIDKKNNLDDDLIIEHVSHKD